MNAKTAELLLFGYRADRGNDGSIERAVKHFERDAEVTRRLEEQAQFDRQMARAVQAIAPPEGLRQKLAEGDPGSRVKGRPFAIPLLLAAICGVAVIIGLLIFFEIDQRERFPGSDAIAHMINTTKSMTGMELARVSSQAGQLGDWFYMRGFEAYAVPPELATAPAVGSRIFTQDGSSIAQVVVDWHQSVIFTFRADEFGVVLPEDSDWRVRAYDDWAGATRNRGGICTTVAFRGSTGEMHDFLKGLAKR